MPPTFRERGAAVPFTSPMLAGARIRLTDRRCDLVVPHPGGARGVYIFALASLTEFCVPTLHDLRLAGRLCVITDVTPSIVRAAARATALEGAAGRAAASAAAQALENHVGRRTAFEKSLLATMLRESGNAAQNNIQHQTRDALLHLGGRAGRSPEAIKAELDLLAEHLSGAGLQPPGPEMVSRETGHTDALPNMFGETARELRAEGVSLSGETAASSVASMLEVAEEGSRFLLAASHSALADTAALLAAWSHAPDQVAAMIARADWFMDGWEQICLLWRLAPSNHARAEALAEMMTILPPIPPEAQSWLSAAPSVLKRLRDLCQHVPGRRPGKPRPSEAVALIDRNERMRALAP